MPVIVRPSWVIGGRGIAVLRDEASRSPPTSPPTSAGRCASTSWSTASSSTSTSSATAATGACRASWSSSIRPACIPVTAWRCCRRRPLARRAGAGRRRRRTHRDGAGAARRAQRADDRGRGSDRGDRGQPAGQPHRPDRGQGDGAGHRRRCRALRAGRRRWPRRAGARSGARWTAGGGQGAHRLALAAPGCRRRRSGRRCGRPARCSAWRATYAVRARWPPTSALAAHR